MTKTFKTKMFIRINSSVSFCKQLLVVKGSLLFRNKRMWKFFQKNGVETKKGYHEWWQSQVTCFNALNLHQKCSMANSCAHRTKMITTVKQKTCGRNMNSLKCSLIMHISGKFIATAAYLHPRCLIRAAALIFSLLTLSIPGPLLTHFYLKNPKNPRVFPWVF